MVKFKKLLIIGVIISSLVLINEILTLMSVPKFPVPYDLGDGYFLEVSGYFLNLQYISHSDSMFIDSEIMKFNYNSKFIIIEQKPVAQYLDGDDPVIRKRQVENCPIRQYWAINKKTKTLYGPYQPGEYKNKFKELGIPDTLQLINSNKRKYHNLWYN